MIFLQTSTECGDMRARRTRHFAYTPLCSIFIDMAFPPNSAATLNVLFAPRLRSEILTYISSKSSISLIASDAKFTI